MLKIREKYFIAIIIVSVAGILALVLSLALTLGVSSSPTVAPEPVYTFEIVQEAKNFAEASAYCKSQYKGFLATSKDFNNWKDKSSRLKFLGDIWKGLSGLAWTGMKVEDGQLTTEDGVAVWDMSDMQGVRSSVHSRGPHVLVDESGFVEMRDNDFTTFPICQFLKK